MRKLQLSMMIAFIVTIVCFGGFMYYENIILDTTPPVITCSETTLTCSVNADEAELLSNVTAYDDVDGDITDKIIIEGISINSSKQTRLL